MLLDCTESSSVLPGVLPDFFLLFHVQMTWPMLSFPLHTAPLQKTTNLLFSSIFLMLGAFSLSETGLILLRHLLKPTRSKVSQVSEAILHTSHPVLADFFPPLLMHYYKKQSRRRCLKCSTCSHSPEPGRLPKRPLCKQSDPTIALTMFELAPI